MVKIKLSIENPSYRNAIPIRTATKYLNGIHDLYYNLAKNKKTEIRRNLSEFDLEFRKLHFSKAEFELKTPIEQGSLKKDKDVYAIPMRDMALIFKLSKKSLNKSGKTYRRLKEIVPDRDLRHTIINKSLTLCPVDPKDIIDIEYRSFNTPKGISIHEIKSKQRDHLRNWRTMHDKEHQEKKTIIGLVKAIVTTTEEPYLYIETNDNNIIKCFYSGETFPENLKVSDLQVTKDVLMIKGTYTSRGGESFDILDEITDIKKVVFDIDLDSKKDIKERTEISEFSLKKHIDEKNDLYDLNKIND